MPDSVPTDNAQPGDDVSALSYEQARAQLGEVVQRLEAGGTTLDESMSLWQRGERIADRCEQLLLGAQRQLDAALAERDDPAPSD